MTPTLKADLENGRLAATIADIAEAAGALTLKWWRSSPDVIWKADSSPVTEADRAAEILILEALEQNWPGIITVAEEQAERDGKPASVPETFWLIDPLDGTRGFVKGGENYTVNIALIHRGEPVAGVVSAPALRRTWQSAGVGRGAFVRDWGGEWSPIRVRARPEIAQAVVSHSLSPAEADALVARFGCGGWLASDSSIKFCLVAEGRCDLYPRDGSINEWDTAAGQAVLEAAGGHVTTLDGARLTYGKPGLVNPGFLATGA